MSDARDRSDDVVPPLVVARDHSSAELAARERDEQELTSLSRAHALERRQECWRRQRLNSLPTYGCLAVVYLHQENRGGSQNRGQKCAYLGMCPRTGAYKLLVLDTKKVITSCLVSFDETTAPQFMIVTINCHYSLVHFHIYPYIHTWMQCTHQHM